MQIYRSRAGTMQVGVQPGRIVQIYRGKAGTMQVGEEAGRSADRPQYSRHYAGRSADRSECR